MTIRFRDQLEAMTIRQCNYPVSLRCTGVDYFVSGLQCICVRWGSTGSAQKKPKSCIASKSCFEFIRTFTQSSVLPLHKSESGLSGILSKVYVACGSWFMKACNTFFGCSACFREDMVVRSLVQ